MNNMMWLSYICMYVCTYELVTSSQIGHIGTFVTILHFSSLSLSHHSFYWSFINQSTPIHTPPLLSLPLSNEFLPLLLARRTFFTLCTCYPFSLLPSRHHLCCLKRWIVWALHTDIHTIHMHTDTRLYVCVFVSDTLIWSCRDSIAVLGIITLTALLLMTMLILLLTVRWSGGQWS